MASKSKVINTVLRLKDDMSGGLLDAAKKAKKAGAQIDDSMMKSTRKVIAWKNKFKDSMADVAKKAATFGTATAAGLAAGFLALDGATEEYRRAHGKLNTAFDAAKLTATDAKLAYEGFYRILGDTDTATEASQLLAELTQNSKDIYTWLHIAAGVSGKFGDSIPIEGLIESMNETAKVGKVTGSFADALNWAGASEDKFNKQLEGCNTEAKRNALIMDTMLGLYNGAAHAFYENNGELMKSRSLQTRLSDTMAGLGDASLTVKNGLLEMAGAQEDGGFRAGSMLDWASTKAEQFASWVQSADFSAFAQQVDQGFTQALGLARDAMDWCREHGDTLIGTLKVLGGLFVAGKALTFAADAISTGKTLWEFVKTTHEVTGGMKGLADGIHGAGMKLVGFIGKAAGFVAANPIVLGIAAAIAAGVLLYKNWDTVKQYASALKDKTVNAFAGIRDGIIGAFDTAKEKVRGFFSWLDDKVENIPVLGSIYKGAKSAGSWIGDKLSGNAIGTSYWRGGLTRVNERGGEIMNLPSGTKIIPHDLSRKAVAGGHQISVNVVVQGNVVGNRQFAREMGDEVAGEILKQLDNIA
ncbi:MAG: hypothetical protein PUI99_08920 [Clostridiales bacterium]|nr:hypothetical protein [Clostridiales bacterium]